MPEKFQLETQNKSECKIDGLTVGQQFYLEICFEIYCTFHLTLPHTKGRALLSASPPSIEAIAIRSIENITGRIIENIAGRIIEIRNSEINAVRTERIRT
jgi:hypothetical protein